MGIQRKSQLWGMSDSPVLLDELEGTGRSGAQETIPQTADIIEDLKQRLNQTIDDMGAIHLGQSAKLKKPSLGVDLSKPKTKADIANDLVDPGDPSGSSGLEKAPDFSEQADVAPKGFDGSGDPSVDVGDAATVGAGAATGGLPGAVIAGVGVALKAIQAERARRQKALLTGLETQAQAGRSLASGTQGALQDLIFGLKGSVRGG